MADEGYKKIEESCFVNRHRHTKTYKSCVMYGRQLTPIGKRLTADIISPVNPTRNNGWMGIVCDRGSNII